MNQLSEQTGWNTENKWNEKSDYCVSMKLNLVSRIDS